MARSEFGGTSNDYLVKTQPFMRPTSGTLSFWSAESGGTQYTDLLLDGGATTVISVPASGFIPRFQGPDGVTMMWADEGVVGGARIRMVTADALAAAAASATAAAASATAAQAVGNTNDTIMAGVVNNGASATRVALTRSGRKPTGQGENMINVRDYGVTGDGTTNDATNLDTALLAASTLGVPAYIPDGNYFVSTSVFIRDNTRVFGAPGARIFGARVGSHIMNCGSGSVVEGLTIENTDTSTGNLGLNIRGSSVNVKIRGCTFKGDLAQAIFLGSSGCSNILVAENKFEGVAYGWLSNSGTGTGAYDLHDVTIANNVFTNIKGDAVSFNHPTSGVTTAGGFIITGNRVEVPDRAGASNQSGFGLGVANGKNVTISNNYVKAAYNHGIHLEDDCANITIVGNVVENVNGTLAGIPAASNVGISIAKSVGVQVGDNIVTGCRGPGVEILYDGVVVSDDVAVVGNKSKGNQTGFAFYGTNPGGHMIIANNSAISNTGSGFSTGGQLKDALFTGNVAYGNGGYGIATSIDAGYLRQFRDNVLYGNTLGDFQGVTTKGGLIIHEKSSEIEGTTGAVTANYLRVSAFRLGTYATGILHVAAGTGAIKAERTYRIKWDGTTLRQQLLKSAISGSIDATSERVSDGVLEALVFTGTNSQAVRVSVQFEGTIFDDGTAYTGIVTATTQATALTAADASTVDTTYGTEEAAVINNLRVRVGELETAMRTLAGLS